MTVTSMWNLTFTVKQTDKIVIMKHKSNFHYNQSHKTKKQHIIINHTDIHNVNKETNKQTNQSFKYSNVAHMAS